MVMWLFSSCMLAIILHSIVAGLATAPPYTPLCRSRFGPVTSTSIYASPRSPLSMDGCSMLIIDVSETSTISALSLSLLSSRNLPRLFEPTSSSPSIIIFTLQGRVLVFAITSSAFMCMNIWPLSSQAPRANILPSFITGSNGPLVHNSSGSAGCTS